MTARSVWFQDVDCFVVVWRGCTKTDFFFCGSIGFSFRQGRKGRAGGGGVGEVFGSSMSDQTAIEMSVPTLRPQPAQPPN